mgnify:FL=1
MFSADGQLMVTASNDGTARVVEAATGRELARVELGHYSNSAAFSPTGATIAAVSNDRILSVWRAWPSQQALVNDVIRSAPRCLTPAERKQYFLSPTPPLWCVERKLRPYHTDAWQAWLPKRKAWLAAGRKGEAPPLPNAK